MTQEGRRLVGLGCVLYASCSVSAAPRVIPDPAAALWVVARVSRDAVLATVGTSTTAWYAAALRDDETLWALTYAQDATALGLSVGPLAAVPACQRTCALLEPSHVFRAQAPSWSWADGTIEEVPSQLTSLLVQDAERCRSPCGRATVDRIPIGGMGEAKVVEAYRGRAIVGTGDGRLRRVDTVRGSTEDLCGGLAAMESSAILHDRIYLAWSGVEVVDLAQISAGAACPVVARIPSGGQAILRSILVLSEEPLLMYATTSSGAVVRFDGGQWIQEARLTVVPNDVGSSGTRQGAIVQLLDGTVVASVGSEELWWVPLASPGHVEQVTLDGKPQRIRAMAVSAALGLVLASDDVGLLVKRANQWQRLDGSGWSLPGLVLSMGNRLVLSAFVSVLVPNVPGYGDCPALTSVGLGVPRHGAVLSSSTAVLLDNLPSGHSGDPPVALVLRLTSSCPMP